MTVTETDNKTEPVEKKYYPDLDPSLPVVACDFDGILAKPTWPMPFLGAPIQEGLDMLHHYQEEGAEIVIFTSRPRSHWPLIWKWLDERDMRGVVYDVTNKKIRASVYIDDRCWNPPWAQ